VGNSGRATQLLKATADKIFTLSQGRCEATGAGQQCDGSAGQLGGSEQGLAALPQKPPLSGLSDTSVKDWFALRLFHRGACLGRKFLV